MDIDTTISDSLGNSSHYRDTKHRIAWEKLQIIALNYEDNFPRVTFATVVTALILGLWTPLWMMALWVLVSIVFAYLGKRQIDRFLEFASSASRHNFERWHIRLVLPRFLFVVNWSLLLLFAWDNPATFVVAYLFVIATLAQNVVTSSALLSMLFAEVLPKVIACLVVPFYLWFNAADVAAAATTTDKTLFLALILSTLFYTLFTFRLAADLHKAALIQIQQKLELEQTKQHVEKANVELESKVRERTKKLEEAQEQLKNSQKIVIQNERLQALGEMAAKVAHDVNNALTPIHLYCSLIDIADTEKSAAKNACLDANQVFQRAITSIGNSAEDVAAIIARLHPLYDKGWRKISNVQIDELCEETVKITRSKCLLENKRISFETVLEPVELMCARTDIVEIVQNLMNNAIEAVEEMTDEARIVVRCHYEQADVCISIEDNGCGMDEATKKQCLTTYYSTKSERNSGLGLATSATIVRSYGGRLEIDSAPGLGASFKVLIPRKQDNQLVKVTAELSQQTFHVLVVDDVFQTAELTGQLLAQMGHQTTIAASGQQALEYLGKDAVDVMLTDYKMPQMNGFELSKTVREQWPEIAIIMMSGYEEPGVREYCDVFLKKPFGEIALAEAFSQVSDHVGT